MRYGLMTGVMVLAGGLSIAACESSKPEPPPFELAGPKSKQDVELSPNAVQLDTAESEDVKVLRDALVFPVKGHERVVARLDRDVVLFGMPSTSKPEQNENGFLRRVVTFSWSKDETEVVVQTEPATLADVVQRGQMVMNFTQPDRPPPASTGVRPKSEVQGGWVLEGTVPTVGLDIPIVIPASNVSGEAKVRFGGSYSIAPQVWADARYRDTGDRTDLINCFQPRPACAQTGDLAPLAYCREESYWNILGIGGEQFTRFGMWCAEGKEPGQGPAGRLFCDGHGNGCIEQCSSRYGAGSTCVAQSAGTDDQCLEIPGTEIPRTCRSRSELTRLELGAGLDINVSVDFSASINAKVNNKTAYDQIPGNPGVGTVQIVAPISRNFILPGAVPIPVQVRGEAVSVCTVSVFGELEAAAHFDIHLNPRFGIVYEEGKFSPLPFVQPEANLDVQVTAAAGARIKCFPIQPKLTIFLFDGNLFGIGPFVKGGYYKEMSAVMETDDSCAVRFTHKDGVEVTIGGEMSIFGVDITPELVKRGVTLGTNWPSMPSTCWPRPAPL
ncbi:MAG: hypothetical protein KF795_20425 [Labilithrix sp.]|nr:hypothetical protein [Labilithrix sp.]MBX3222890.1 hypothetical protein [Labilithrix sp.]